MNDNLRKDIYLLDEYANTGSLTFKELLLRFIKSCDGIKFMTREEVVHTMVNLLDLHILDRTYKCLVEDIENNMDAYNDVFFEAGIYHMLIPASKKRELLN